jgi:hypothetical protein
MSVVIWIVWDWTGRFIGENTDPEIGTAGSPISIQQNVIEVQIAVNDSLRVDVSHRKDNANNNSGNSSFSWQTTRLALSCRRKIARQ